MAEKKEKLEHEFIPEHSKLSEKDAKEILKKYNATVRDMPKIYLTDPAISHLGVKEGDIIRMARKSRTAGNIDFYRAVIKE